MTRKIRQHSSRLALFASAAGVATLALGCTPPPPRSWQGGGATLEIPDAQWILGEDAVHLTKSGEVIADGDVVLSIDRVGRVYDEEGDPLGVLEPNGTFIGTDDEPLGMVGSRHASLPEQSFAWITVEPNGRVVRYGEEGERYPFGAWFGCGQSPRSQQACTLVTHALGMRMRRRSRQDSPAFTFGVGVGVPLR